MKFVFKQWRVGQTSSWNASAGRIWTSCTSVLRKKTQRVKALLESCLRKTLCECLCAKHNEDLKTVKHEIKPLLNHCKALYPRPIAKVHANLPTRELKCGLRKLRRKLKTLVRRIFNEPYNCIPKQHYQVRLFIRETLHTYAHRLRSHAYTYIATLTRLRSHAYTYTATLTRLRSHRYAHTATLKGGYAIRDTLYGFAKGASLFGLRYTGYDKLGTQNKEGA